MATIRENAYIFNAPVSFFVDKMRALKEAGLRMVLKSETPRSDGSFYYRVKHKASLKSYGENITVLLMPISAEETEISIHSECLFISQLADWGQNQANVEALFNYFSVGLPELPAEAPANQDVPQLQDAPAAEYALPADSASPAPIADVSDELRQLKALADEGIISQSDFEAKKKQLLGI